MELLSFNYSFFLALKLTNSKVKMDKGFILLSRNIIESEVFASQKLLKIWVWCLCKSNFKDRSVPLKIGRGETIVKVSRGSFIFGRHKAEEELFIDGSTIYKAIKQLEKLEMISIVSNNQYSIVTVNKYNEYQNSESYKVATKEQPSNNQVTAEEQPRNTTNTLKQDNKDNKDNNINNSLLSEIKISDVEISQVIYFEIALAYQKLFIKNLKEKNAPAANQEKAKYKAYVDPIRLMMTVDKVTKEQLTKVYKYLGSIEGEFWKSNILSTSKLREKFQQLLLKSQENGKSKLTDKAEFIKLTNEIRNRDPTI